jgi:RNA polymerase sigma factor (sigma-70 family)
MDVNDEEIIQGCINKDIEYMEILYEKYVSKLYNCALRYTKKVEDAEDVLQDAFIQIFEKMKQYDRKGTFAGWMTTIVINQALMLYRKNLQCLKYHAVESENEEKTTVDIKDESIVQSDFLTHKILLDLIQSLPDGYRMVFNMHELEGYSYEEIAELLNCTPSTCRSQLFRAKKVLQAKIENFNKRNEDYNRL